MVTVSPFTFALLFAFHTTDDAEGLEVIARFTAEPLQTVVVAALVINGVGLIVTVTCCAVPGHEPTEEVGVTVYTTVSTAVPVLVIVLLMVEVDCDVVLSPVVFALLLPIQV